MGQCTCKPSTEELANHENYSVIKNDKSFYPILNISPPNPDQTKQIIARETTLAGL